MADVIDKLRKMVVNAGGQRPVAEELGISVPYLCDILAGKRNISARVAYKLGYEWKLVEVVHMPATVFTGKGNEIDEMYSRKQKVSRKES